MGVTKEGTFLGIEVVISVIISEARAHPFQGQETGLEIHRQLHLGLNDSQLKSDLLLAANQYQRWSGNKGRIPGH